jgi:hypothetical protein
MRRRQSLSDPIEGRLSSPDARAELVRLATRPIVEQALEAESRDAPGREYYEHGASPGQGYRNGSRAGRLKTAEGRIEYAPPHSLPATEGRFISRLSVGRPVARSVIDDDHAVQPEAFLLGRQHRPQTGQKLLARMPVYGDDIQEPGHW